MLRYILEVLRATWMAFHVPSAKASSARYWRLTFETGHRTEADPVEALDGHLRSAVRRRKAGDVLVGAYVSRGLDSSALARIAADYTEQLGSMTKKVNRLMQARPRSNNNAAASTIQMKPVGRGIKNSYPKVAIVFSESWRQSDEPGQASG